MASASIGELLDQLDAEWVSLRALLAARDDAALAQRPPSGKWSVLENLRHMLFAEQAHLGMFIPGGRQWSPVGYTPQAMLAVKRMATENSGPDVTSVLTGWEAVHAATRLALQNHDTDAARHQLRGHLRHQQQHVLTIERLLRASEKARG